MIVIPDAKPSKPSNQFIALVIPVSQTTVIKNFINTGKLIIIFVLNNCRSIVPIFIPMKKASEAIKNCIINLLIALK